MGKPTGIDKNNYTVSIITVNYFCLDEIEKSYLSIIDTTGIDHEYIIVSNSPIKQEKKSAFNLKYPAVKIIQLENNLGFATANNIGNKHANGKYLFFLNPDTRFQNDVLKHLLNEIKDRPEVGILGPRTVNANGNRTGSVKNDPSAITLMHQALPFLKRFTDPQFWDGHYRMYDTDYVEVVNGSALFIPKNLFHYLEGMNESYFMYWEENDLCFRVRKLGYYVIYTDTAIIKHFGKATTSDKFLSMEIEKHRSKKIYLQHYKPKLIILNRFIGIISYLWRTIFSIFSFRSKKIKQFGSLLLWYTFSYK